MGSDIGPEKRSGERAIVCTQHRRKYNSIRFLKSFVLRTHFKSNTINETAELDLIPRRSYLFWFLLAHRFLFIVLAVGPGCL